MNQALNLAAQDISEMPCSDDVILRNFWCIGAQVVLTNLVKIKEY